MGFFDFIKKNKYKNGIKAGTIKLSEVPEEYMSISICKLALIADEDAFSFIPEKFRTEKDICELAVLKNGLTLKILPKSMKNRHNCKRAVTQNGLALKFVPEKNKTQDICEAALKENGKALKFVPVELAIEILKTKNEQIIKSNGLALEYLDDAMKTPELCMLAVKQNGQALKYVPNTLSEEDTLKIRKAALAKDGTAIHLIPDKEITEELMLAALKENGAMIEVANKIGFLDADVDMKRAKKLVMAAMSSNCSDTLPFIMAYDKRILDALIIDVNIGMQGIITALSKGATCEIDRALNDNLLELPAEKKLKFAKIYQDAKQILCALNEYERYLLVDQFEVIDNIQEKENETFKKNKENADRQIDKIDNLFDAEI